MAKKETPTKKSPATKRPKNPVTTREDHEETETSTPELDRVAVWQKKLAEDAEQRRLTAINKAKKPTGRASKNTKSIELMERICTRVAGGEGIARICEDYDMPDSSTVYDWIVGDKAYEEMYNKALVLRGEKFGEDTTRLSEEALLAPPELTNAYRLAVDTRKWAAARLLPKKYGDRVTLSGDAENPLVTKHIVDADDLLKKMRKVE